MSETNEASVESVVHTPGPWKVSRSKRSVLAGGIKINQLSGPCAASAGVQIAIDRELQANAKLIAAAPDMLEALRRIVRHQDAIGGSMVSFSFARYLAAQAIQHATGEQV